MIITKWQKISMEKLQTDYLDLVLLHQPFGDAYGAWRALERFYEEGKIRAIGISNFYADRMVEWFSSMVEERKHNHDCTKEKKNW